MMNDNISLLEYFKENNTNIYTSEILYDRNVFIHFDTYNNVVEITDNNGNSVNIYDYVDISINTKICDIKDIVLNYLFDNYLYKHC